MMRPGTRRHSRTIGRMDLVRLKVPSTACHHAHVRIVAWAVGDIGIGTIRSGQQIFDVPHTSIVVHVSASRHTMYKAISATRLFETLFLGQVHPGSHSKKCFKSSQEGDLRAGHQLELGGGSQSLIK